MQAAIQLIENLIKNIVIASLGASKLSLNLSQAFGNERFLTRLCHFPSVKFMCVKDYVLTQQSRSELYPVNNFVTVT